MVENETDIGLVDAAFMEIESRSTMSVTSAQLTAAEEQCAHLPQPKCDRRDNNLCFVAHPAAMDHFFSRRRNIAMIGL